MPTKKELEDLVKKLRKEVLDLREKVVSDEINLEDLTEEGYTYYHKDRHTYLLNLKFNPETREIVIMEEKDLGKDLALAIHKLKKELSTLVKKAKKH